MLKETIFAGALPALLWVYFFSPGVGHSGEGLSQRNPVTVPEGFEKFRPRVEGQEPLPPTFCGGFLCLLQDQRLLNVYHSAGRLYVSFSADGGDTWIHPQEIQPPEPNVQFGRPSALESRDGTIWLFTYGFVKWSPDPEVARSDVWLVRSRDEGNTWDPPRTIWRGYTGMTQGAIETRGGHILFPFCYLGPRSPGEGTVRFVGGCLVSTDRGGSWQFAGGIEVPSEADAKMRKRVNGGALEPSVVELVDGRVWMVLRTVTGYLWECFSEDGGLTWSKLRPSKITCGGPVYVTRFPSSGRIAMVWNEADWSRAEQWSGWPNGYARASIALAAADGRSWHAPVVYAEGGTRTVHSMVVEYAPGKLLISMMERDVLVRSTVERLLDRQEGPAGR